VKSEKLVYYLHKEVPLSGCLAQWASSAMRLPLQEPEKLTSLGMSSEQPLGRNLCALLLYSLILSWQGMWTTPDNKLHSLQPCVQVCQTLSSVREEGIVHKHLQIRHISLTHVHMLQGAPTPGSTQCGVPLTGLHIWKECCMVF
jgi:hypothetical protein